MINQHHDALIGNVAFFADNEIVEGREKRRGGGDDLKIAKECSGKANWLKKCRLQLALYENTAKSQVISEEYCGCQERKVPPKMRSDMLLISGYIMALGGKSEEGREKKETLSETRKFVILARKQISLKFLWKRRGISFRCTFNRSEKQNQFVYRRSRVFGKFVHVLR